MIKYYKEYFDVEHTRLEAWQVIAVENAMQYYAMDETVEEGGAEPPRTYRDNYFVEISVEEARKLKPNLVAYFEKGDENV
jgi:hypothetical protein